ncbi:unnamed protein product [Amoebophrya sp. A120]|nr:unnamed protein product [Amoebophrya sp. A120]|eukprot:GSA120T00022365001.1
MKNCFVVVEDFDNQNAKPDENIVLGKMVAAIEKEIEDLSTISPLTLREQIGYTALLLGAAAFWPTFFCCYAAYDGRGWDSMSDAFTRIAPAIYLGFGIYVCTEMHAVHREDQERQVLQRGWLEVQQSSHHSDTIRADKRTREERIARLRRVLDCLKEYQRQCHSAAACQSLSGSLCKSKSIDVL